MTVVFVHGVPETAAIWDLLAPRLAAAGHDDQIRLSPPGFGVGVPDGFGATVEDYRRWLVAELERIGRPVDLVGHDFGGAHAVNVAITRPDLIRSWCSDAIGLFDPDYVWHDRARIWQTPDEGERWIEAAIAQGAPERAAGYVARGVDPTIAARIAPALDADMGACMLRLYRSAAQPVMATLGTRLEAAAGRPGLVVLPTEDHFVGTEDQRRRSAARAGARVDALDGLGHWWMAQDGGRQGAATLISFWASL